MTSSIDTVKRLSREQRKLFLIFGALCLGILAGISVVYVKVSDILREQAEPAQLSAGPNIRRQRHHHAQMDRRPGRHLRAP